MVTDVITVGPDACVQEVAEILLKNRISAVPVIGTDGTLRGIVSEGDLMRRVEAGTGRRRTWWLELLSEKDVLAARYIKEHSRKVEDIMTRNVVTAAPDTPLHLIANLLEKNGIKRVPIVEGGKIVGIVSRANLIQAVASIRKIVEATPNPDDETIRKDVMACLNAQPWEPSLLNIIVHNGTVELWGIVDSQSEKKAARVAAEATKGVCAVNDNLVIRPAGWGT